MHLSTGPDFSFSFKKIKIVLVYTATSHEVANQSRFLIGIKKGDERNVEIHDGQALDLSEVGRGQNAPATRTIGYLWIRGYLNGLYISTV